ncbi:MAG: aminotransferase class V-fold PLP-dependent enzyme [Pseudomonadota bacterium]
MSHETRDLLADAAKRAVDYLDGLDERSVSPQPGASERLMQAIDTGLPQQPVKATEIIDTLDRFGSPATVASAGGRYFGFVTGGALPATVAAQYLAGAWDQNSFSFVSSPAIACFETVALRWVKEALGLPSGSEGALVTGATMANFTCLAAARNWGLDKVGWNVDRDGLFGAPDLSIYVGEEAHATLYKVLSMLGLGRDRVHRLPADDQGRIRADGLPAIEGPAIVCIQAGNVNSGAFDPAPEIIRWAHQSGAWVHVDGAFGLWALASPDRARLATGYEAADSWATDAHKWLNVPYDSGVALVREPAALARAMSITGAYLTPSDQRDAMMFTPDSSRRARAVEIWAALKSLGRTGLADLIDRNCRHAHAIANALRQEGVEVLNDVELNQVVAAFGDDARTHRVMDLVQRSGECWCGGTVWRGRAAMRISVSSWATTDRDIERSIAAIIEAHRST